MNIVGRPLKTEDLRFRYEVTGWGYFPTDMLRYDRALVVWAEEKLAVFGGRPITTWTILGATKPTVGRWESFMYNIVGKVERA
jgi:hypothetical protein